jgi:hypothetical protein
MTSPVVTTKLVANIVKEFLGLADDQVVIYNQKWNIPTDSRLYVVVSLASTMPYSASKKPLGGTSSLSNKHTLNTQETLKIDLLSAGQDAVARMPEVIMALGSDYSQSLQELHGFKLATIPTSVQDTSAAEVTRMLFRTTVEVKVLRAYNISKTVAYYDKFEHEEYTEGGQIE